MKTYKIQIPIGELFDLLGIDNDLYNAAQIIQNRIIKIEKPNGEYTPINAFVKKQGFVRNYTYDNGDIACDEKHLVKQDDNNFVFIKDATHLIVNGHIQPIKNKSDRTFKDVYDISIDSPHEYVTAAGVVCHNTTIAKIITSAIECDLMYINASDENSVDTVRTKIKSFASTVGFKPLKVVICDEFDFMTANGQAALRNLMETYSKTTRFILTCNYIEKVIDPIQSRCQTFAVNPPSRRDVALNVVNILKQENVTFEPQDVATIVNVCYPDIRKVINSCQRQVINGVLTIDKQSLVESNYMTKVLELIKKKSTDKNAKLLEIRQLIADSQVRSFEPFYRFMFDNLEEFAKGNEASAILILGEYAYFDALIVDKELNVMAMLVKLVREL